MRFAKNEHWAWAYLEAASGRFLIRGDELGEYVLRLERDIKPVRWVCRTMNRATTVRLIDDTGRDDAATCSFFSFRRPAESVSLDAETILGEFQIPSPGGLFEARHGEILDTVIVSLPQIEGGLKGLVIEPDLHDLDTVHVPLILEFVRLWSEARPLGPLVDIRRKRVIERLINRLYARLCGHRWAEAEAAYLSNPDSEFALQRLQRSVGGPPAFSSVLRRDYERMESGTGLGTQWFAELAARYQVCSEIGLCEFALQLTSHPDHLLRLPEHIIDGLLLEIKENMVLLRGARLLALLAATKDHELARTLFRGGNGNHGDFSRRSPEG